MAAPRSSLRPIAKCAFHPQAVAKETALVFDRPGVAEALPEGSALGSAEAPGGTGLAEGSCSLGGGAPGGARPPGGDLPPPPDPLPRPPPHHLEVGPYDVELRRDEHQ